MVEVPRNSPALEAGKQSHRDEDRGSINADGSSLGISVTSSSSQWQTLLTQESNKLLFSSSLAQQDAASSNIISPWDAEFYQAAQKFNERFLQHALDHIEQQEEGLKKTEDDNDHEVSQNQEVDDDKGSRSKKKNENADNTSHEMIVEEQLSKLKQKRDTLANIQIPTTETISIMEQCFVSFIHAFCPPSSKDLKSELRDHTYSKETDKVSPKEDSNAKSDGAHASKAKSPPDESNKKEVEEKELHSPVPYHLLEKLWLQFLFYDNDGGSHNDGISSPHDDCLGNVFDMCPTIKAVLNVMESNLVVDTSNDNSRNTYASELDVARKDFLVYVKQALIESLTIVELDAPTIMKDAASDKNSNKFIQLKQSAADSEWPTKFLVKYYSTKQTKRQEVLSRDDKHNEISAEQEQKAHTRAKWLHSIRNDAFHINKKFIIILDETLTHGKEDHERLLSNIAKDQTTTTSQSSATDSTNEDDAAAEETSRFVTEGKPKGNKTSVGSKDEMPLALKSMSLSNREQKHSYSLIYAIEHLSTHCFQLLANLISTSLPLSSPLSSSKKTKSSDETEKQTLMIEWETSSVKDRLFYWLLHSPLFRKWRLDLYMNINKDEPERQLLENDLLYLDACTRLLHLSVKIIDEKEFFHKEMSSKAADEEKWKPIAEVKDFLKIHSNLEKYLTSVWETQIQPTLAESLTNLKEGMSASSQQQQETQSHVLEGSLNLQKKRYQKIVNEFRQRQYAKGRFSLLGGDVSFGADIAVSSIHDRPHDPRQEPFSRASSRRVTTNSTEVEKVKLVEEEKKEMTPTPESDGIDRTAEKTTSPTDVSKNEKKEERIQMKAQAQAQAFESEEDRIDYLLKVAIGIGRMLHSTAMSLGRFVEEYSLKCGGSWSTTAVNLEEKLYLTSLAIFNLIATYLEQNIHSQLSKSNTTNTGKVAGDSTLTAEHHLHSSDKYVQNQLDIADTLSCLGYVQDAKRHKYNDALQSYQRAVEIYGFFMGDTSEATEKAWHNIGILHVALFNKNQSTRKKINASGRHSKKDHTSPKEEGAEERPKEFFNEEEGKTNTDNEIEDGVEVKKEQNALKNSLEAWRNVLACQQYNFGTRGGRVDNKHMVPIEYALEIAGTFEYIGQVFELMSGEEHEAKKAYGKALMQVTRIVKGSDGDNVVDRKTKQLKYEANEARDRLVKKICPLFFKSKEYERIVQLVDDLYEYNRNNKDEHNNTSPTVGYATITSSFYDSFLRHNNYNLPILFMTGVSYFKQGRVDEATTCLASYLSARGILLMIQQNADAGVEEDKATDDVGVSSSLNDQEQYDLSRLLSLDVGFSLDVAKLNSKHSDHIVQALFSLGSILQEQYFISIKNNQGVVNDTSFKISKGKEILTLWNVLLKHITSATSDSVSTTNDKHQQDNDHPPRVNVEDDPSKILHRAHIRFYIAEMYEILEKDNVGKVQEEYKFALELFEILYSLNPDDIGNEDNDDDGDEKVNEKNDPLQDLSDEEYGSIFHRSQTIWFRLGKLSERNGNMQDAIDCFGSSLRIQKEYANAIQPSSASATENAIQPSASSETAGGEKETQAPFFSETQTASLAETIVSLGYIYSDSNNNELFSPPLALKLLQEGARLFTDLVSDPEIKPVKKDVYYKELEKAYHTILVLGPMDSAVIEQQDDNRKASDIICDVLFRLGNVCGLQKRYEQASQYYYQGLSHLRALGKENDLIYGSILHNYGIVLAKVEQGQTNQMERKNEARESFERALEITEEHLGSSHPAVGDTLHELGVTIFTQGNKDEFPMAIDLLERSRKIREKTLGADHIVLSHTLCSMGQMLLELHKSDQALTTLGRALQIRKKHATSVGNPNSVPVADVLHSLGMGHLQRGTPKDRAIALSCLQEAARIRSITIGRDNGKTCSTLYNVAMLQTSMGDDDSALTIFEEILQYYKHFADIAHKKKNWHTEDGLSTNIAKVLSAMGDIFQRKSMYKDARRCHQDALDVYIRLKNKKRSFTSLSSNDNNNNNNITNSSTSTVLFDESIITTLHNLAVVCDKSSDKEAAIQFYTRVLLLYRKIVGQDSLLVGRIVHRVGELQMAVSEDDGVVTEGNPTEHQTKQKGDDFSNAVQCLKEALRIFVLHNDNGAHSEMIGQIHYSLGHLLCSNGNVVELSDAERREKALRHFLEALPIVENMKEERRRKGRAPDNNDNANNNANIQEKRNQELLHDLDLHEIIRECIDQILILAETTNVEGDIGSSSSNFSNSSGSIALLTNDRKAMLYFKLGNVVAQQGEYEEALSNFSRALYLQKDVLSGNNDLDVANTLHNIGNALYKLSKYPEAMKAYEESLKLAKLHLGSEQEEVAETLNCIGDVHRMLGNIEGAKEAYGETIRIRKLAANVKGTPHRGLIQPLLHIASIRGTTSDNRKDGEEALACYKEVLKLSKALQLADTPHIATALHGIASLKSTKLVDLNRAFQCLTEALRIRKKLFDHNNISVPDTMCDLGAVCFDLGRVDEAQENYNSALTLYTTTIGENSPQAVKVLNNLGLIMEDGGNYNGASRCYERALNILKNNETPEAAEKEESATSVISKEVDIGRGDVCHNYGVCLNKTQKYEEAISFFDEAVMIYESLKVLPLDRMSKSYHAKGVVLTSLGRTEEAAESFSKALECMRIPSDKETITNLSTGNKGIGNTRGESVRSLTDGTNSSMNEDMAETRFCFAKALFKLGKTDEASVHFKGALRVKLKTKGKDNLQVASILFPLGLIHARRGELIEAKTCLKEVLRVQHLRLGIDGGNEEAKEQSNTSKQNDVAETQYCLGLVCRELGEPNEALALLTKSLHTKMEVRGPSHIETGNVLFSKGQAHMDCGQYDMALESFRRALEIRETFHGTKQCYPYARAQFSIGCAFQALKKIDRALTCFTQVLDIYKSIPTSNENNEDVTRDIMLTQRRIGSLNYELGEFSETKNSMKPVVEYYEQKPERTKEDSKELSEALHLLGIVSSHDKDSMEAMDLFARVITIHQEEDDGVGMVQVMISIAQEYISRIKENEESSNNNINDEKALKILRECLNILRREDEANLNVKQQRKMTFDKRQAMDKCFSKAYAMMVPLLRSHEVDGGMERAAILTQQGNNFMIQREFRDAKLCYEEVFRIRMASQDTDTQGLEDVEDDEEMDRKLAIASALHNLGCANLQNGDLDDAVKYLSEAVALSRATAQIVVVGGDEEIADSLYQLGVAYRAKSDHQSALLNFKESAATRFQLLAKIPDGKKKQQNLALATTLLEQGGIYEGLGDYDKAFTSYRECLRIRRQELGPDDPSVAAAILSVGNVHRSRKEYDKALSCYNEFMRIQKLPLYPKRLFLASTSLSIGNVYESRNSEGDTERARSCYSDALEEYIQALGRDLIGEPRSTNIGFDMAGVRLVDNDLLEKFILAVTKIAASNAMGEKSSTVVGQIIFNVAQLFDKMDDKAKALKLYDTSIYHLSKELGNDCMALAGNYIARGILLEDRKFYKESIECYQEALRIKKIHIGSKHAQIEDLYNIIGTLYDKVGDREEALKCYGEAVRAQRARMGNNKNQVVDDVGALTQLASEARQRGDLEASLRLYEEVLRRQKLMKDRGGDSSVAVGQTLHQIGTVFNAMGKNDRALNHLSVALRILKNSLGADSLEVAHTEFFLGVVCCDAEQYDESMTHYIEAMRIRRARLGADHVQVAQCLHNIAILHYETNQYRKSIDQFEKALKIFNEKLGPDHEEVGYTYNGLANAHRELRHGTEAALCFKAALRIKRQQFGKEHLDVGDTLHNLGVFYLEDCDRYAEAIQAFQEAVLIRRKHLGPDSIAVAETLQFMAEAYLRLDKKLDSLKLLEESIRIQEVYVFRVEEEQTSATPSNRDESQNARVLELLKAYGKALELKRGSVSTESTLDEAELIFKKGNLHSKLGQYNEAIQSFDRALDVQTKLLGPDHLTVANTLHNLGTAEMEQNDLERAEHHLVDAMETTKKILGGEHVEYADTLHTLATVYRKREECDKAVPLYDEASQIKRLVLGNEHLSLARTLFWMGSAYEAQENFAKTMRCYMECLRIQRMRLGPDHRSVALTLFSIGGVHKKRGENDRAIQVYRECLRIRRLDSTTPNSTTDVANVLHNLATVLDTKEEYEEALQMYEEALDIFEEKMGGNNLVIGSILANMGGLLSQLDDFADAGACYKRALELREHELGDNHRDVADTRLRLGIVEDKLRHDDIAMDHYKKALQLYRNLDGLESEPAAKILHGMAILLRKEKSKHESALKCATECLRIRKLPNIPTSPEDLADTLYVVGTLLEESDKDRARSLECFLQCEDIYRKKFGPTHIYVGDVMFHAASIFEASGDVGKAMSYYKQSLGIKRQALGSEHLEVATILCRLGVIHQRRRENEVAVSLLDEALRIQRSVSGSDNRDVGKTLLALGAALDALSKWDRALETYLECLQIFRAQVPRVEGITIAKILSLLGGVFDETAEFDSAISNYEEAISIFENEFAPLNEAVISHVESDSKLRQQYLQMADIYFNLGAAKDKKLESGERIMTDHEQERAFEEAVGAYKKALEMYVRLMGTDCVDAAKTLDSMGLLYARQNELAIAGRLLDEALRIRILHFGEKSTEAASTMFGLGLVRERKMDYEGAKKRYEQVLSIQQVALGTSNNKIPIAQTHTSLGAVLGNIGEYQKAMEQWDSALKLYREARYPKESLAVKTILDNIQQLKKVKEAQTKAS